MPNIDGNGKEPTKPQSPAARLERLERLMAKFMLPRMAHLEHESEVQAHVMQALMLGTVPTELQIKMWNDETANLIMARYPMLRKNVPKAGESGGLVLPGG